MIMILTHMLSPSALLVIWFRCQFLNTILPKLTHQPVHIQNNSVFMQAAVQAVEQSRKKMTSVNKEKPTVNTMYYIT